MDDAHGAPHSAAQAQMTPRVARADFNLTVHGARGLFAATIVIYHMINSGLPTFQVLMTPPAQFVLRASEYGVELFFCISGYVIVGTLRRARGPGAFLEDRAIRIFPVLWVTVGLIAALRPMLQSITLPVTGGPLASSAFLVANLLALPGLTPIHAIHPAAWSLSYEFGFYIFCTVAWVLRDRLGAWTLLPTIVAAVFMLGTYPRAIFFLSGVIVALAPAYGRGSLWITRYPLPFVLIFLAAWHEIQALTPQPIIETTLWSWAGDIRLALALLAFLSATLAFAGIAGGQGMLGWLLRTRLLLWLGTISYSLYLWHPLVMSVVKQVIVHAGLVRVAGPWAQFLLLALTFPPSLLVAHLSQRVLERKAGMWLRRRLHHRPPLGVVAEAGGRP